jgi:hypothetical protein
MSQQKPSPPPRLNSSLQQRPRSNSVIKLKSSQNSPTQSPTTSSTTSSKQPNSNNSSTNNQFKRSMSVSEGLHVRLPTLHHSETEPFPYSPVSQHSTTNNICPSESNWANKYDDFDIGKPIGNEAELSLHCTCPLLLIPYFIHIRLWIFSSCL